MEFQPMSTVVKAEESFDNWTSYLSESKKKFDEKWAREENSPLRKNDFNFLQILNKGTFSTMWLAKRENSFYAVKCIRKSPLLKMPHLMNERRALQATQFPFVISMAHFFTDVMYFYFVMPFIPGGDLFTYLRRNKRLPERDSKFYAAQVVLALEYLHYMKIVFRDLKPENIMIETDGYIKVVDLGFCKRIEGRTYTICGTTQFISPEVLLGSGHWFPTDWWSFGVLVYEMNAGFTPFFEKSEWDMCERIARCDYSMDTQFSKELQDLVRRLLQTDPGRRMGNLANGVQDIKAHRWFRDIKWMDVFKKRMTPPYVPVPKFGSL